MFASCVLPSCIKGRSETRLVGFVPASPVTRFLDHVGDDNEVVNADAVVLEALACDDDASAKGAEPSATASDGTAAPRRSIGIVLKKDAFVFDDDEDADVADDDDEYYEGIWAASALAGEPEELSTAELFERFATVSPHAPTAGGAEYTLDATGLRHALSAIGHGVPPRAPTDSVAEYTLDATGLRHALSAIGHGVPNTTSLRPILVEYGTSCGDEMEQPRLSRAQFNRCRYTLHTGVIKLDTGAIGAMASVIYDDVGGAGGLDDDDVDVADCASVDVADCASDENDSVSVGRRASEGEGGLGDDDQACTFDATAISLQSPSEKASASMPSFGAHETEVVAAAQSASEESAAALRALKEELTTVPASADDSAAKKRADLITLVGKQYSDDDAWSSSLSSSSSASSLSCATLGSSGSHLSSSASASSLSCASVSISGEPL